MTTRDTTIGATWRRLVDLGYSPTSASHPDRITNAYANRRESFIALAAHPAAVQCYPRLSNGAVVEDGALREIVSLVITAYVLADAAQWKPVKRALEDRGLLAGPVRIDGFGNQMRPLRWNGPQIYDGEYGARLAFDDDDSTVFLQHAIAPERFETRTDQFSRPSRVATSPVGSHIIALDGAEWRGGTLLDTPREKLPQLLPIDVPRLISDIEAARWEGRPAAKGSAAA